MAVAAQCSGSSVVPLFRASEVADFSSGKVQGSVLTEEVWGLGDCADTEVENHN